MSAKIEEVESGEVAASPLSEVISKKRAKTQGIQTSVDTTGHVRIVRQKAKGSLPAHTEELRTVLRVEANMWTFLASKYRNQAMFRGMTPAVWLDYVNYLLGDKVYLMQVPTPGGKGKGDQQPLRPPWQVLLTYEYEMRREAVKKAFRESRALVDTLTEVQGNAQLKEQFFVSPIALQGRSEPAWKRPWQPGGESEAAWGKPWDKWQKGNRKGDFKGSKKGKEAKSGKKGKDRKGGDLVTRTPDNRLICFAYSGAGCDGSCGMVHCCQVRGCGKPHPTWQHWMEHHGASRATDGAGAKS